MLAKITHCSFLDVAFDDIEGSTGDNGDSYTFTITTPGGQKCIVNGDEVDRVSFTIVGNAELEDFFEAVCIIKRLHKNR